MKQIWYECIKLSKNRVLLFAVLACLAAVLAYQAKAMPQKYTVYDREEYQKALQQAKEMEPGEALVWLERESEWYSFLAEWSYGEKNDFRMQSLQESYPEVDWEKRAEEFWERQDGAYFYDLQQTSGIYRSVRERIEYMISYSDFLETVQKQAKSMLGLSLFSKVDAYTEKNIQKTAEVYKKLETQSLGLEYSDAPAAWSESSLADVLMLVLALLFGWQIFCREREDGLYLLLKGTRNGRVPLFGAKTAVYALSLSAAALLLYGSQVGQAYWMYGIGDTGLPLASLSKFRNCPYPISIGEYTVLYLAVKVLGVLVFGSVAMLFLVRCRRYGTAVGLYFLIAAAEYLMYQNIDSASSANSLKYLNLAAILDGSAWFAYYRNLNIFSNAFSAALGKLLLGAACLLFFGALAGRSFCRCTEKRLGQAARAMAWIGKKYDAFRRSVPFHFGAHKNLFFHEGYKLYRLGGMALALAAAVAASLWMADGAAVMQGGNMRRAYSYYMEQLQGVYTEEKAEFLEREEAVFQRVDPEALQMEGGYQKGTLSEEEYLEWTDRREHMIMVREDGFSRICQQKQALEQGWAPDHNAGFVDLDELACIFEDDNRQMAYAIVFLLIMILGVSWLFGIEYQGMLPLVQSAQKGRRPLCMQKMLQALLFSTLLYAALYAPYYRAIWQDFRFVEKRLLLRAVLGYERFELRLTIGQAFWLMVLIRYGAAISCTIAVMGITRLMKQPVIGSGLCFLLLTAPCCLQLMGVDLSDWTCTGGFLPELVYRSGGTIAYYCKMLAVLAADMRICVYLLRESA